jgi:peptidoglycan-N-acetylglucosamine deacetylase
MPYLRTLFILLLTAVLAHRASAAPEDCAYDPARTHLSRIIAADSTNGPIYGQMVHTGDKSQVRTLTLLDHEVVLTFDDGPLGATTPVILDILDRHCVKATFFPIGGMALLNSKTLREIADRGHTIGSHTWSHPLSIRSMPLERIKAEIEGGFAAVSQAAGTPVAPFFRFPGLGDSPEAIAYLASRNISVWSVDVVAGDAERGATAARIAYNTLTRLERLGRGIILFHDIKRTTADALDGILTNLENNGYKVVHVVSNTAYQADSKVLANPEILRSMAADAFKTGRRAAPNPAEFKEGLVSAAHTEWLDLDPEVIARQRLAGAIFEDEPELQGSGEQTAPTGGEPGADGKIGW